MRVRVCVYTSGIKSIGVGMRHDDGERGRRGERVRRNWVFDLTDSERVGTCLGRTTRGKAGESWEGRDPR